MPDPRIALHEASLAEIRRRRHELADETRLLDGAESYHQTALVRLGAIPHHERLAALSEAKAESDLFSQNGVSDALARRLKDMTKHDAAVVALEKFGGTATVPQIVDFLREHNYGLHLPRKMMINGMRTALDRKTEMFVLKGSGVWSLKKKEGDMSAKV